MMARRRSRWMLVMAVVCWCLDVPDLWRQWCVGAWNTVVAVHRCRSSHCPYHSISLCRAIVLLLVLEGWRFVIERMIVTSTSVSTDYQWNQISKVFLADEWRCTFSLHLCEHPDLRGVQWQLSSIFLYWPYRSYSVLWTDFAVQFMADSPVDRSHEVTDLENNMVSTQEDLEEAARQWEEQQRTQCHENNQLHKQIWRKGECTVCNKK